MTKTKTTTIRMKESFRRIIRFIYDGYYLYRRGTIPNYSLCQFGHRRLAVRTATVSEMKRVGLLSERGGCGPLELTTEARRWYWRTYGGYFDKNTGKYVPDRRKR